MKRFSCLFLVSLLLWGCAPKHDSGIYFVYPKKDYVYSISEGSVSREKRDVSDRDLSYLVRLYLLGPQDEGLTALFPTGVRLERLVLEDSTLSIVLSNPGNQLTDISFSLAGACLAQTLFDLCEADTVVISSGDRQITLKRDALVFQDSTATLETTANDEQNEK